MAAVDGEPLPVLPQGALAPPGRYLVTLTVAGKSYTAPLEVKADPRLPLDARALAAALELNRAVGEALDRDRVLVGQLEALTKSLKTLNAELGQGGAELRALMRPLEARIEPLVAGKGESSPDADAIGEALVQLAIGIESSDRAPTAPSQKVLAECEARLSRAAAEWSAVQKEELARLNAALGAAGKKPIEVPPPDRIAGEPSGESEELP
jgi:hypothetical protein